MGRRGAKLLMFAGLCCLFAVSARAGELTIGMSAVPSSLDPYYHNAAPNLAVTHHIFDRLVHRSGESEGDVTPALAESWSRLSDTLWEFRLRRGVRFHDGAPFTAEDVAASFRRAPTVEGPGTLALYIRAVKHLEVVDDYTIRIGSDGPYPLLLNDLSQFPILSRRAAGATAADFDRGGAAIGTGPFQVARWAPGDRLELTANPHYWGGRPKWDRATLRFLPDDAERLAALAAGEADIIDNVPAADLPRFRANPAFDVVLGTTGRVIFLRFNFAEQPRDMRDRRDRPLTVNPFRDIRVRRAISLAVNREAMRDLEMEGLAQTAGQPAPDDYAGASPRLRPDPYDPATARRLLREAGYPDGFTVTLACTNNRYLNDEALCRTIVRALAAVGIEATANPMPARDFFPRAARGDFDFMLGGWGSSTGEASYPLKGLLATRNARPGWGSANHGGYSNPRFDQLLGEALTTNDDGRRAALLRTAMETAMDDVALVPLHFQMRAVALRRPLRYHASKKEAILATDVEPGP